MNRLKCVPSVVGKIDTDMLVHSYGTLTAVFSDVPLEVIRARKERNLEVQVTYRRENRLLLKMKAWRYRYIDFLHKVNLNADISM